MHQPLHDVIIYGHPEGEHMIVNLVVPLAVVPLVDLEDDDDVDIPVIHVEHLDDDLGDGEVHDIVILELPSPVVSVVDVSSTASSIAPSTHTPASSPDTILPTPAAVPPTPTTNPCTYQDFHTPCIPHLNSSLDRHHISRYLVHPRTPMLRDHLNPPDLPPTMLDCMTGYPHRAWTRRTFIILLTFLRLPW
ncbi:hypothetical protein Hanom_Chr16g01463591 [Helianthus anomalus]